MIQTKVRRWSMACMLNSSVVQVRVKRVFSWRTTTHYLGCDSALPAGLLEMSPVDRGVVTLFGVRSRLFIAMSNSGQLYSSVRLIRPRPYTLWVVVVRILQPRVSCRSVCCGGSPGNLRPAVWVQREAPGQPLQRLRVCGVPRHVHRPRQDGQNQERRPRHARHDRHPLPAQIMRTYLFPNTQQPRTFHRLNLILCISL